MRVAAAAAVAQTAGEFAACRPNPELPPPIPPERPDRPSEPAEPPPRPPPRPPPPFPIVPPPVDCPVCERVLLVGWAVTLPGVNACCSTYDEYHFNTTIEDMDATIGLGDL